jgi:hypothetical protein
MQTYFPIFAGLSVRSFPQTAVALAHPINNPGGPVSLNPQPLPPRVYRDSLVIATTTGR